MKRVLFVTNGHGETAIADLIAANVRKRESDIACDHLALVGASPSHAMTDVGPRRPMPSGGLIAMGNVRNITRDLRGGLIGLTLEQRRFLRESRERYDVAVAVGDVFALLMTLSLRAPAIYVGTAKSVHVAPYGRVEEAVLRKARRIFVRDEPTAELLRKHGVAAEAPGNAIVDLFAAVPDDGAAAAVEDFAPAVALFPGSRENAYGDASFLVGVVRGLRKRYPRAGAVLSVAPSLDAATMLERVRDGSEAIEGVGTVPFTLLEDGVPLIRAWRGDIGPLLRHVELVLGQAGTANEAAAAAGVPVVAFERGPDRRSAWYRMRQVGLLGEALAIVPAAGAVEETAALLNDPERRARMGDAGRARMGPPGGSERIGAAIVDTLHA